MSLIFGQLAGDVEIVRSAEPSKGSFLLMCFSLRAVVSDHSKSVVACSRAIAVHVLVVSTCILQDGGGAAPRPDAPAGLKERCRPPRCLSRGSAELADTSKRREAF